MSPTEIRLNHCPPLPSKLRKASMEACEFQKEVIEEQKFQVLSQVGLGREEELLSPFLRLLRQHPTL